MQENAVNNNINIGTWQQHRPATTIGDVTKQWLAVLRSIDRKTASHCLIVDVTDYFFTAVFCIDHTVIFKLSEVF